METIKSGRRLPQTKVVVCSSRTTEHAAHAIQKKPSHKQTNSIIPDSVRPLGLQLEMLGKAGNGNLERTRSPPGTLR